MTAPVSGEAPWRFKLQSAIAVAIGIVATGAGAVFLYFDFHNSAEAKAYRSALACSAPGDALIADSCRYTGPVTVTRSTRDTALTIDLVFSGLAGQTFTTRMPLSGAPPDAATATGATATAELWSSRVTRFADVTTADDPENQPMNLALGGWIFVVTGLGFTAWALSLVRRAWSL